MCRVLLATLLPPPAGRLHAQPWLQVAHPWLQVAQPQLQVAQTWLQVAHPWLQVAQPWLQVPLHRPPSVPRVPAYRRSAQSSRLFAESQHRALQNNSLLPMLSPQDGLPPLRPLL